MKFIVHKLPHLCGIIGFASEENNLAMNLLFHELLIVKRTMIKFFYHGLTVRSEFVNTPTLNSSSVVNM